MLTGAKQIAELCNDPKVKTDLMAFHRLEVRWFQEFEAKKERSKVIRDLLETGPANRKELRDASGFSIDEILESLEFLDAKPVDDSMFPKYSL